MSEEYDVEKIIDDVEKAILAGKYRHASEKESREIRLAALENITASCKIPLEKPVTDTSVTVLPAN